MCKLKRNTTNPIVTNPIVTNSIVTNPIYSIDKYSIEILKQFSDLEWINLLKENLSREDFIYLIKIRLQIK